MAATVSGYNNFGEIKWGEDDNRRGRGTHIHTRDAAVTTMMVIIMVITTTTASRESWANILRATLAGRRWRQRIYSADGAASSCSCRSRLPPARRSARARDDLRGSAAIPFVSLVRTPNTSESAPSSWRQRIAGSENRSCLRNGLRIDRRFTIHQMPAILGMK